MPADELRGVIRGYRREQVVSTALRVFGQLGSVEASLDDIAAEAGISRSTIYNHFSDRGELLRACASYSHERLSTALAAAVEPDGGAEVVVARFFAAAFTCLDENPGFYRLATSLAASRSVAEAVLDDELSQANAQSSSQVGALAARLHTELDVDVAEASWYLGVVLAGALEQRAQQNHPLDAEESATALARLVLGGLAVAGRR